jgi:tyrosine decarboxylase
MKKIDVDALFLGPKSENHKFFKEMLNFLIDEHVHWRRDFHPDDKPCISSFEQSKRPFQDTLSRTEQVLLELSSRLKASSEPWFSPRYLGQMNSDVLMCAVLGYMATILYNPNNCAYEGAPATTPLEIEVGKQLAAMMGYDPKRAWGHITTDGTVANYEGLWFMRNMKSIPLAVREVKPELVEGLSKWQLLNMPPRKILELVTKTVNIKTDEGTVFDEVRAHSVRGTGVRAGELGKLLVPRSKHYSWPKAVDILGIGQDNLVCIDVKNDFRMDIGKLEQTIDELTSEKGGRTPILGVVSVVGTTEEGAVDEVHEVVSLRKRYEEQGIGFYYHIDAAYGGYTRSMFLDRKGKFMSYKGLKEFLHEQGAIHEDVDWPSKKVYAAYKAMSEADSITVDPHKMGYVPYAAGAIVAKDKRVCDLVSYFAAYVFGEDMSKPSPGLLGAYILEGSKSGAAAASVWAAHQTVPLDVTGYGRVIGRSVEVAHRFYQKLAEQKSLELENGKRYRVVPLTKPDFNMVCWAFNREGNTDLKKMNALTLALFDEFQYVGGPVYYEDFLTSHTEFTPDDYGDAPIEFLEALGIPAKEYEKEKSLWILRASLLTPFLDVEKTFDDYWERLLDIFKKTIARVDS